MILNFLFISLVAFIVFFIIDLLWLGVIAKKFYNEKLKHLKDPRVKWIPAVIFYMIYILILTFFVLYPGINDSTPYFIIYGSALIGLLSYSTYELTNYSVLIKWPLSLVIVDILWGVILTTSTGLLTYLIFLIPFINL
ncbi:MAG: DUF2177 family protein [Candidatus Woesearchaeota archaeon]